MNKKAVLPIALVCALLFSAFDGTVLLGMAQSSTNVSGLVTVNTTWTKANSPYTLTGPVAVESSATLTFDPGVTVNFNGFYIKVNGTLVAIGTTDNIHLNNGSIMLYPVRDGGWNEQAGSDCIIENTIFNLVSLDIMGSPKISNNTFSGSLVTDTIFVRAGSPKITNNIITGAAVAIEVGGNSSLVISNNTISDSYIGIDTWGPFLQHVTISNNVISSCTEAGISAGGLMPIIERNLIINNRKGIVMAGPNISVKNNTIVGNLWGIDDPSYLSMIIYNNIQNNTPYNIHSGGGNYDVSYNWWGTTDTQAINQSIYDFKNDFNLGNLTFVPFLSESNSQAPPIPTLTTKPTPSPASTPTSTPNQSPSLSPSQSPTLPDQMNSVPLEEFYGVVVVLVAVIFALLIVIVIFNRRKKQSP
jgi:hypothetical protein